VKTKIQIKANALRLEPTDGRQIDLIIRTIGIPKSKIYLSTFTLS
jgi:hypothetical protein